MLGSQPLSYLKEASVLRLCLFADFLIEMGLKYADSRKTLVVCSVTPDFKPPKTPAIHMGSFEETYSQNVHERLTPFAKFNNLGYNEIIKKDIFRKFEDVATTKNQQHLYIESARDINQKFYPQHSGSNYNSELNFN